MRNIIKTFALTLGSLLVAGSVFAATVSVKIEQPKSPTNLDSLTINFVVLDAGGTTPITAKCFYSKDAGPAAQFGSDVAISAGGNSANCVTNASIINGQATYHFYVTANGIASDTVSVEYNTSGPDTPTSYSKEDFESCKYKIKFHTADDGKTVKVELYRSANTTFDVNDGSKISSQNISPNTDGEFITDKPDCGKTYYYAIRAFDSIGNGSGVRGDSETHTTTTTVTTASGASGAAGAIPAGTAGNVLGTSNGTLEGATGASGAVLGEASGAATPTPEQVTYTPPKPGMFSRNVVLGAGAIAVILLGIWLVKRKKSV